MSDERLMELRDALYLGLDNYYPNMIGELMEAVTGLKAENEQLKEEINKLEQKTKALIDPADLELYVKCEFEDCVKEFIKDNSFDDRKWW